MVAFIQSRNLLQKLLQLLTSIKADCLFAGSSLNRIIQKNEYQKKAHFVDDALKTRASIYLNVETWFCLPPPYQNF